MTATLLGAPARPAPAPANALLAPQVQAPGGNTSGAIVPPIAIALGSVSKIPYPTSNVGPVPIPWQWVVLVNSSPYTLTVTSGVARAQIPAFTADLVQVNPSPAVDLVVMPQAGSGTPVAGSDSTVYATFYATRPAGSFPAAIGSGAVVLQSSSLLFAGTGTVFHGGGTVHVGTFNVAGLAALRVIFGETIGIGTGLLLICNFLTSVPFGAARQVGVPGGGNCNFIFPCFTDQVAVFVQNNDPVNDNSYALTIAGTTQFGGVTYDSNANGVLLSGTANIANGGNRTITGLGPYAGPAQLNVTSDTVAALGYKVQVLADVLAAGTYASPVATFSVVGSATPSNPNPNINTGLILPACALKVIITNAAGAAANFSYALIADSFRTG